MPLRYWLIYTAILAVAGAVAVAAAAADLPFYMGSSRLSSAGGHNGEISPYWVLPFLALTSALLFWRGLVGWLVPSLMCLNFGFALLYKSLLSGPPPGSLPQLIFVAVIATAAGFGWYLRDYT